MANRNIHRVYLITLPLLIALQSLVIVTWRTFSIYPVESVGYALFTWTTEGWDRSEN